MSDPGYAPAIEIILKEIQSPQIIPVEIKESVGATSSRIQQAREAEESKIRSGLGFEREETKFKEEIKQITQ